jgi:hypothetical protein
MLRRRPPVEWGVAVEIDYSQTKNTFRTQQKKKTRVWDFCLSRHGGNTDFSLPVTG